jgi:hypothetical protein
MTITQTSGPTAGQTLRRSLLITLASGCAAASLPAALAQPIESEDRNAFLRLSELLTGRSPLEPAQVSRLFAVLTEDDPEFAQHVRELLRFIDEHRADPAQLQAMLDAEKSTLAAVPRRVVTAWYLGVVGDEERARCVLFETSLMNVIVANRLSPPSYCFGAYGSWAEKPG